MVARGGRRESGGAGGGQALTRRRDLPPLEPPERIRGHLKPSTPGRVKIERLHWVHARMAEGHSRTAIAAALGISAASVSNMPTELRSRPDGKMGRSLAFTMVDRGVLIGSLRRSLAELPDDLIARLEDTALAKDKTMAQVLCGVAARGMSVSRALEVVLAHVKMDAETERILKSQLVSLRQREAAGEKSESAPLHP